MRSWSAFWTALVAISAAAAAEARSVAFVPLVPEGSLSAEDLFQVGEAIAAEFRGRGHPVLAPQEAAERIEERSPGCMAMRTPRCWCAAAAQMAWDTVVGGRIVRQASSSDVSISLVAYDSRGARVIGRAERAGPAASRADLLGIARATAATLMAALPESTRYARLVVESRPSGAKVFVAGAYRSKTPWSGELPEGSTTVRVELAGHRPGTRTVDLQSGESETIVFTLAPVRGGSLGATPHRFDVLDGILLGAAALAVGGGTAVTIASVAPGDECSGDVVDDEGDCQFRQRAGDLWPVAGIMAAGAALAAVVVIRFLAGGEAAPPADGRTARIEARF